MTCAGCGRNYQSSRSTFCLACSGCQTIQRELCAEWRSETLRNIASDLIVSCSRQVHALRIFSGRDLTVLPAAEVPARIGDSGRAPLPRSRKPETEAQKKETSGKWKVFDKPVKEEPIETEPRGSGGAEEKAEASEYYSTTSSSEISVVRKPERKGKSQSADRPHPGAVPKANPEKRRRHSGGEPASDSKGRSLRGGVPETPEEKLAAAINPKVIDFQDPAFKEASKREYLEGLAEVKEKEKKKREPRIQLKEAPSEVPCTGRPEASLPRGNLLLAEDLEKREGGGKKRRKKQWPLK